MGVQVERESLCSKGTKNERAVRGNYCLGLTISKATQHLKPSFACHIWQLELEKSLR